ncbi:MAG: hypothetical protein GY716_24595 [bacterium]|nr:hypothetical protein [bacterium]
MQRRLAILCLLLVVTTVPAVASAGVAELQLDREAVRRLVALSLPAPLQLEFPLAGAVSVSVDEPRTVRFVDGGVEVPLQVRLQPIDRVVGIEARFVPQKDPLSGVMRLVPESVRPSARLPSTIDLAQWIGSVELPRRLDWDLALEGGETRVTCYVQGLEVGDERLQIRLGLVTK